ncbi:MAG: hypothetical protein K8T91_23850 [Planctomycetes bacterium]|nr:hypothetical protein [Planctomycetota bacterium]
MSNVPSGAEAAAGFLTVVDSPVQGLLGGYLILNALGRPLEFHCTAPIKPNRAQEILYGATLLPFIYGEQIGQTLLRATQLKVPLVLTDLVPMLATAELVKEPVALLLPQTAGQGTVPPGLTLLESTTVRFAIPNTRQADRAGISAAMARLGDSFDWPEPFGRIRDAIGEAQRAAA